MTYADDFTPIERLRDVLAWAEVVGRLTEEEVELVEASMTAEAIERHRWAERLAEFEQWTAEAEAQYREGRRQRDAESAARDVQYIAWHRYLGDLEMSGRLSEALAFDEWAAKVRPRGRQGLDDTSRDAGSIPARSTIASKRAQEVPF